MDIKKSAKENYHRLFPKEESELFETDPELMERFVNFAYGEVLEEEAISLSQEDRLMCQLAVLMGAGGIDEYKHLVKGALNAGISPVVIKEILYQGVDYLGMGRVLPFIKEANKAIQKAGIELPLDSQATTTMDDRLEKGVQTQVDIFGDGMKEFYKSGPDESKHINRWLAANCFGDFYTRRGLDLKQREMVTFCYIYAQGGCEPQLISHAAANMKLGNDKKFLISIISQCLPFIGYPRTLNALNCINEAEKNL